MGGEYVLLLIAGALAVFCVVLVLTDPQRKGGKS